MFGIKKKEENPYISDGLVFWLDAILQNKKGFTSWIDFSGNYSFSRAIFSPSGIHGTFIDFYRDGIPLKNADGSKFIGDILSGFSIEVIYQPRYTNYNAAIQDTPRSGAQSMLVGFSNSEYFLQANGQLKLPGGSNIGTDVFDNSKIMHITWTYDGSLFKRYVDGVNDIDVAGTLNTSGLANVFILGYVDWSWITRLCFNNLRVYSRTLSQAEITSNYSADITRFGTENVL
jgi:hypothetical protein